MGLQRVCKGDSGSDAPPQPMGSPCEATHHGLVQSGGASPESVLCYLNFPPLQLWPRTHKPLFFKQYPALDLSLL